MAQTIRTAVYGDESNTYKEEGDEYKIRIEFSDDYKKTTKDLSHIFTIVQKGLVPLEEIGKFVIKRSIPTS